jgi:sec-independent protein translocase protein TatA
MKIGVSELLIVLAIVLLLFGPSQIPKLTKMFGKGVKSFKDGLEGTEEKTEEKQNPTETGSMV